jgi:hypothetical protein
MTYATSLLAILTFATAAPPSAQTLSQRVIRAPDGHVRFSMPARANTCGYEDAILIRPANGDEDGIRTFRGSVAEPEVIRARCTTGPVRVDLTVRGNRVRLVSTRVGAEFDPAPGRTTDLGTVSSAEGVEYLLALAPSVIAANGDDPLIAVALADGVDPADDLMRLAANTRAPKTVRMGAIFWATRTGATTEQLRDFYESTREPDLQEHVVFAFSLLDDPTGTRELLRVARGDDASRLRRKAVFLLGQRAGEAITRDGGELASAPTEAEKVRESDMVQIARGPRDAAVPSLIQIARTSDSPHLRERALFLLAEIGDDRAIDLFESILIG